MAESSWVDVDDYYASLFLPSDDYFRAGLDAARAAGLPQIQVSAALGRLLELLARLRGARRILEIGTLGAYSTTWLARALPPGGSLITLELSPHHAEVARANLERAGLGGHVEIRLGPAGESLAALHAEGAGPFDMIFIDADKAGYPDYFTWSMRLSAPGTLLVIDNVVRGGKVVEADSTDASVQGVRRMNELIAVQPNLVVTTLQTVGTKGYDGITIAYVTD
jgi:predicted O-methyltransferase YrrM